MTFSNFIKRPVLSTVISIFLVLSSILISLRQQLLFKHSILVLTLKR